MKKKLVETSFENGEKYFYFVKYDDLEDFEKIIQIIKERLNPSELNERYGWDDASGYFVKEGIRIGINYDMTGNEMVYQDRGNPEELEKVRKWVKTIWEALETGDE